MPTLLRFVSVAVVLFSAAAASALPVTIFQEDFETSNGGSGGGNLGSAAFPQWTVEEGLVDISGPGFFEDIIPNTDGSAVDLDASITTGPPGKMKSIDLFFAPGEYELMFDYASAGFGPNRMEVSIGSLFPGEEFSTSNVQAWTTATRTFLVPSPTTANLIFDELEAVADTGGVFIDNITVTQLTAVPTPAAAALALPLMGLLALARPGRRRAV